MAVHPVQVFCHHRTYKLSRRCFFVGSVFFLLLLFLLLLFYEELTWRPSKVDILITLLGKAPVGNVVDDDSMGEFWLNFLWHQQFALKPFEQIWVRGSLKTTSSKWLVKLVYTEWHHVLFVDFSHFRWKIWYCANFNSPPASDKTVWNWQEWQKFTSKGEKTQRFRVSWMSFFGEAFYCFVHSQYKVAPPNSRNTLNELKAGKTVFLSLELTRKEDFISATCKPKSECDTRSGYKLTRSLFQQGFHWGAKWAAFHLGFISSIRQAPFLSLPWGIRTAMIQFQSCSVGPSDSDRWWDCDTANRAAGTLRVSCRASRKSWWKSLMARR